MHALREAGQKVEHDGGMGAVVAEDDAGLARGAGSACGDAAGDARGEDARQIRGFALMEDDGGDFGVRALGIDHHEIDIGIVVGGLGHDVVQIAADGDDEPVLRGGIAHCLFIL